MNNKRLNIKQRAFTIVELLIGISIVAILTIIALPNLNKFIIELRVDNEISELHKLLLIARNTSVNSGRNVIVCPIVENLCHTNWHNEVSVFIDLNADGNFDINDEVIRVKAAPMSKDTLKYSGGALLAYNARGNLTTNNAMTTFSYCPDGYTSSSRGIDVSISGRAFVSRDTNGDGIDEDRNDNNITCN